jgi:hypothetical protein
MALELHSSKGFMTANFIARSVPAWRRSDEEGAERKITVKSHFKWGFFAVVMAP